MKYVYLLSGGIAVSVVHVLIVWHHQDNRKYSISEHAIITRKTHILYFATHVFTEITYIMFSYQFFVVEQRLHVIHYLNIIFVVLDFMQAALPSRGKTEKIHYTVAYISWVTYLLAGILAFVRLDISSPFNILAALVLAPALGMFLYMHINRSKLYPYQLAIVPLFALYMLLAVIGARSISINP